MRAVLWGHPSQGGGMARIKIPDGPAEELHRLWMMCPELTAPASAFSAAVYNKSKLSVRLRELLRMRIAPDQPLRGLTGHPGCVVGAT